MVFRILSGNLLTTGHAAGSVYVHAGTHLPGVGTSEDAQSPHLSLRLDGPKASARRSLTSKHRFAKSVVHWTGESSPERRCTALVFSLFRNDGRVGYSLGPGLLRQVLGETSNLASTVTPSGMVVGRAGRRRNQRPSLMTECPATAKSLGTLRATPSAGEPGQKTAHAPGSCGRMPSRLSTDPHPLKHIRAACMTIDWTPL